MTPKIVNESIEFLKLSFCIPYFVACLIYYYLKAFYKLILPSSLKSLEGETILITGCATGIGRAIALKLAKNYEKITLILWDYNDSALQQVVCEVKALGTEVYAYCVDVSDHQKVAEAAERVRKDSGDYVSILINNAGVAHNRGILKLTPEQIERTMRINCLAHFWTIREFLPKMIEKNHGHISGTCSMGGHLAVRGNVPYFTSKFAVKEAMMALRNEIKNVYPDTTGVHLTTVYPWFVHTPLLDKLDIQFRFPNYMQLVESDFIADKAIEGIQKNQEDVLAPSKFGFFLWLENVLPEPERKKVRDFSFIEYRGTEDDITPVIPTYAIE